MFLKDWTYDGTDPGLKLFTLANPLLPEVKRTTPAIFEIGCCDTDFMERAGKYATVYGIDWCERKHPNVDAMRGDVMTARLFECRADAIISLSTIEHIGLGRYDHDPLDPYGDIKTIQRLREHLAPGGFIYFDVPYAPEGYFLLNGNKCRVYDDVALRERFGPHTVLGYTTHAVDGWIEKPTTNQPGDRPYYYAAILIERKDGC